VSSLGSAVAPFLVAGGTRAPTLDFAPAIASAAAVYLAVGVLMLFVAVCFIGNSHPKLAAPAPTRIVSASRFGAPRSLAFAMVNIFLFVGTEATLLAHVLAYRRSYSAMGPAWVWSGTLAGYWILVTVGRWLAYRALGTIDLVRLLRIAALGGAALVILAVVAQSGAGTLALLLTGLVNAAIFPVTFSLCVEGLDLRTLAITSGFLMTAICGGAVIPVCSGLLADEAGLRASFLLPVLSYLWIAFSAARCRNRPAL
jgi:FHS family L-fucose permease-like MFS transporter